MSLVVHTAGCAQTYCPDKPKTNIANAATDNGPRRLPRSGPDRGRGRFPAEKGLMKARSPPSPFMNAYRTAPDTGLCHATNALPSTRNGHIEPWRTVPSDTRPVNTRRASGRHGSAEFPHALAHSHVPATTSPAGQAFVEQRVVRGCRTLQPLSKPSHAPVRAPSDASISPPPQVQTRLLTSPLEQRACGSCSADARLYQP